MNKVTFDRQADYRVRRTDSAGIRPQKIENAETVKRKDIIVKLMDTKHQTQEAKNTKAHNTMSVFVN